jgi:hypothetical protein
VITRALLRSLRNDLPMPVTLRLLGDKAPYSKSVEGRCRFVCPYCAELLATVNPRNNLAHCFNCRHNLNNIDLLIALGYGFCDAVEVLQRWLGQYTNERAARIQNLASSVSSTGTPEDRAGQIGSILRREFGKDAQCTDP